MLYELSRDDLRGDGLGRFAHRGREHIAARCLHPYRLISVERLYEDMLALGCAKENAHIMCVANDAANRMPLLEALREAVYGGTLLVVSEGATAVYYEAEPDFASEKFLIY